MFPGLSILQKSVFENWSDLKRWTALEGLLDYCEDDWFDVVDCLYDENYGLSFVEQRWAQAGKSSLC